MGTNCSDTLVKVCLGNITTSTRAFHTTSRSMKDRQYLGRSHSKNSRILRLKSSYYFFLCLHPVLAESNNCGKTRCKIDHEKRRKTRGKQGRNTDKDTGET